VLNLDGIFDTHTHYDDGAFDRDREEVLQKIFTSGVKWVLNCGERVETSRNSKELAHKYPQFHFAAGIHPEHANEVGENDLTEIKKLASDEKCAAIGEIGLDYHYPGFDKAKQKELFNRQLELAQKLGKAAVIHSRDATADMVETLGAYKGAAVLHCFSESPEIAKIFLKKGFYLGFGGVVTFKNARRAVESAALCPLDRILLETDCPYMAPAPFRGKRNDSSLLPLVAEKLAQIKGITPEVIVQITAQNAKTLFKIN